MYRNADGEEKPSKRSKSESTQGAVAIQTGRKGLRLCIPKFSAKEVYSAESWANEIERQNSQDAVIPKGGPHERNPCAPKSEERLPEETSRQEECARQAAWDLQKYILMLKAEDKATFYSRVEIKRHRCLSPKTQKSTCLWMIRELQCTR